MSVLKKSGAPPRRTSSQAMKAYREKYDSVEEHTMPLVRDLSARIDRVAERAGVRKTDPGAGSPSGPPEEESQRAVEEADTDPPPAPPQPSTEPETREPRPPRPDSELRTRR